MRVAQLKSNYATFIWTAYHRQVFIAGSKKERKESSSVVTRQLYDLVAILNTPAFRLLDVAKMIRVLVKVLSAYFHYKYPQFAVSAQTLVKTIVQRLERLLVAQRNAELMLVRDQFLKKLMPLIVVRERNDYGNAKIVLEPSTVYLASQIGDTVHQIAMSTIAGYFEGNKLIQELDKQLATAFSPDSEYVSLIKLYQLKGIERIVKIAAEQRDNQAKNY